MYVVEKVVIKESWAVLMLRDVWPMGMRIGEGVNALSAIRTGGAPERTRTAGVEFRSVGQDHNEAVDSLFFNRDGEAAPRVGFGAGTISGPVAAVRTLRNGLREARRVLPSQEEVRERIRERLSEERKARIERVEERRERQETSRRVDRPLLEPAAGARDFVNRLDRTAAASAARLAGEPEAGATGGARVEVAGREFVFARGPDIPPRFDVTV